MRQMTDSPQPAQEQADLSLLCVRLLKGVIYRDEDGALWTALHSLQPRVRDYMRIIGLELLVDDAEGYAFVRGLQSDDDEGPATPKLVARRPLSFPVSLLLALLRRRLAEFDAGGADTRLILGRDDIVELLRVFLPDSSNESRLIDQIDAHINKVVELGYLRRLRQTGPARDQPHFEVRRILKAFVDAQWLSDFDDRLAQYQAQLTGSDTGD